MSGTKRQRLKRMLAGEDPGEEFTKARPRFNSVPVVLRAQQAVNKQLEEQNTQLQAAYRELESEKGVSEAQLKAILEQVQNDARSLESLFNNPTGDNYLNVLFLLTKLLPPTTRNAIQAYVTLNQSSLDPWYLLFQNNNTSYKKAYFGTRENDIIVQFIMWIAKHHVRDCLLNYDTTGGLAQTTLALKHENYVRYAQEVYPFVAGDEQLDAVPVENSMLFALIGDIAIDLLYNISLTCSSYPQGSALRNCIKYLKDSDRLPKLIQGKPMEQQNVALYILPVFTKNYTDELQSDDEAQQAFFARIASANYQMRPTATLSVRLRLA